MKTFPLNRGSVSVDEDIYDQLVQLRRQWWRVKRQKTFYAVACLDGTNVYMHRWILGVTDGNRVDHEDGNGLNNQRLNLRIATPRENSLNQKHRTCFGILGLRGVARSPGGRFRAYITDPEGKHKSLGVWPTSSLAATARDIYVSRVQSFAVLNYPEGAPHSASEVEESRRTLVRTATPLIRFKYKSWESWARLNGRRKYLGRFATKEEALATQARAISGTITAEGVR